jgi:hypothetical protein
MTDDGFGSELWKNVQAVKLGQGGSVELPVRADGTNGIVLGGDSIAANEELAAPGRSAPTPTQPWWKRLFHHR